MADDAAHAPAPAHRRDRTPDRIPGASWRRAALAALTAAVPALVGAGCSLFWEPIPGTTPTPTAPPPNAQAGQPRAVAQPAPGAYGAPASPYGTPYPGSPQAYPGSPPPQAASPYGPPPGAPADGVRPYPPAAPAYPSAPAYPTAPVAPQVPAPPAAPVPPAAPAPQGPPDLPEEPGAGLSAPGGLPPAGAYRDHPRARAFGQVLSGAMGLKVVVQASPTVPTAASSNRGAYYNPAFMAHLESQFGASAVAGVLAHELGHIKRGHVNVVKGPSPSWLHARELEADLEAGCALAKLRIDPRGFIAATVTLAGAGSASHPPGWRRQQAITRGYRTCATGQDLARGRILPDPGAAGLPPPAATAYGLQPQVTPVPGVPQVPEVPAHSLGDVAPPYRN